LLCRPLYMAGLVQGTALRVYLIARGYCPHSKLVKQQRWHNQVCVATDAERGSVGQLPQKGVPAHTAPNRCGLHCFAAATSTLYLDLEFSQAVE